MTTRSVRTWRGLAATALGVAALACLASDAHAETISSAAQLSDHVAAALTRSYQKSPAAVVVAAAGLALPVLGLALMALRRLSRLWRRWFSAFPVAPTQPVPAGPAWLEIEGVERRRMHLRAELSRMGRDVDNDVTFTGPGMAATHAVIQRTPECGYLVVDVSGDAEGSLTVNGTRCRHATLVDGDRIAFGRAAMTFRNGAVAPLTAPPRDIIH